MNKRKINRQAKQNAKRVEIQNAQFVEQMRRRVNASTETPKRFVPRGGRKQTLSRKKRQNDSGKRQIVSGFITETTGLSDGLNRGYDLRGAIWIVDSRQWLVPENFNPVR